MTRLLIVILTMLTLFTPFSGEMHAIENPLAKDNNFIGIHILFPEEIGDASTLVNGNGGEWGYVIIPIRTVDMDLVRWQKFMNEAKEKKVIPIVRIATEPSYKDTSTWRIPHKFDAVDYANFLNSLTWPTKNKYVVLYNEVNRFDEWGGSAPDPIKYADTVERASKIFKERDEDFYVILGGLDNGAPNDGRHMNNFTFLQQIADYKPEIFNMIDGFSSHSYPNPAFAQPPSNNKMGVATYRFEYNLINKYTNVKKPAFITETGWDATNVTEDRIAEYYKTSLEEIWGKDRDKIVAITPFILRSHGGFDEFSFLKDNTPTKYYQVFKDFPKIKGEPTVENTQQVAGYQANKKEVEKFSYEKVEFFNYETIPEFVKEYGKMLLGY